MGLGTAVRSGVALAKRIVGAADGLLVTVTHRHVAASGGWGEPTTSTLTYPECVLKSESRAYRTRDGLDAMSAHTLSFIENIAVSEDDQFTLPDGSTGPILAIEGVGDPDGGRFTTRVVLGLDARGSGQ